MDCCNHLFRRPQVQSSPFRVGFLSQNRKDLDKKHAIMRKYSKIFIAQYCAIWYIPKSLLSITWVERFNVQARPGATTIIKEINPLLLKACALDPTS